MCNEIIFTLCIRSVDKLLWRHRQLYTKDLRLFVHQWPLCQLPVRSLWILSWSKVQQHPSLSPSFLYWLLTASACYHIPLLPSRTGHWWHWHMQFFLQVEVTHWPAFTLFNVTAFSYPSYMDHQQVDKRSLLSGPSWGHRVSVELRRNPYQYLQIKNNN